MLSLLTSLFLGRRRGGIAGLFDRRRHGGAVNAVNSHRGASALGAVVSLAAPYVIKKLLDRRAQNRAAAAA